LTVKELEYMTSLHDFEEHTVFERYSFFTGRLPESLAAAATSAFDKLWNMHPPRSNEILIHGRMVPIPRWQQAYGRDYQFSGTVSSASPVPDVLVPFLGWVREAIDDRLNGLLLNWYDAAKRHYIGPHRDSRQGLVVGTPIVTISVGSTRTFRLRLPKESGFLDFEAAHGSVFVMPWETNVAVKHEVPHNARVRGRRISITVRAFAPN
jgi:alkylated DNA repair dioxygenase AlkB